MRELRRATAQSIYMGPFISKTDGVTLVTPASIADANIFIIKNSGASYADATPANRGATTTAATGSNSHVLVVLGTDDTAATGRFRVFFTGQEGTALPVWEDFEVLPESIYDAKYGVVAGTDAKTALAFTGVDITSTTGVALNIAGSGTGNGVTITSGAGASAVGVSIVGGAGDSSVGVKIVSNAATGAGNSIEVIGSAVAGTVGSGIKVTGASAGSGIRVYGGPVAGNGITVTSSAGAGINITPVGGPGVLVAPPAGQHGVSITNTTASAINLESTTGSALKCASTGTGTGIDVSNSSTGSAMKIANTSNTSAVGALAISNGSTTYGGASVSLIQTAAASTHAVHIVSGTALGGCVYMSSRGTGPAVAIESVKNGIEIAANTATGSAIFLRSGSTIPASTTTSGATVVIQGNGVNTTAVEVIGKGTGNAANLTSVAGTILSVSGSTGNLPAISITGGSGGILGNGIIVNAGSTTGTDAFKMVGTGAGKDISAKEIDGIATTATGLKSSVYGGSVWIDTVNGVAGSVSYVNGVPTNPCSNLADALIVAAALKLKHFQVLSGSSITLASNLSYMTFTGDGWTLAMGGRALTGCVFIGAAISGTWTGTGTDIHNCDIGAITMPPSDLHGCGISGPITVGSAGDFFFDQCYSRIAGDVTTNSPIIDWVNSNGPTNISLRHYAGGIRFQNMKGSDKTTVAGTGIVVIDSTCTAGTVVIRGTFELSNSGNVTLVDGARIAEDQTFGSNLTRINGTVLASATLPLAGLSIVGNTTAVTIGSAQTEAITVTSSTGVGIGVNSASDGIKVTTSASGAAAIMLSTLGTYSYGVRVSSASTGSYGAFFIGHEAGVYMSASPSSLTSTGLQIMGSIGAAVRSMNSDAVVLSCNGATSGGTALKLEGYLAGNGIAVTPGATGHGISVSGGATSGRAIYASSTNEAAVRVSGGVSVEGNSSNPALALYSDVNGMPTLAISSGSGPGVHIIGRTGVRVAAQSSGASSSAVELVGYGSGGAVVATPGTTGHGISVSGGATSGNAVHISGGAGSNAVHVGASGIYSGIAINGGDSLVTPAYAVNIAGHGSGGAIHAANSATSTAPAVSIISTNTKSAVIVAGANTAGTDPTIQVTSETGNAIKYVTAGTPAAFVALSQSGAVDMSARDLGGGTATSVNINDTSANYAVIAKAVREYDSSALGQVAGSIIKHIEDNPATLATSQPNYAPAKAGDAMALAPDQTVLTVLGNVNGNVAGNVGGSVAGSVGSVASGVTLATSQPNYAPSKAGDKMDIVNIPNSIAVTAIQSGLATSSALSSVASGVTTVTGKLPSHFIMGSSDIADHDGQIATAASQSTTAATQASTAATQATTAATQSTTAATQSSLAKTNTDTLITNVAAVKLVVDVGATAAALALVSGSVDNVKAVVDLTATASGLAAVSTKVDNVQAKANSIYTDMATSATLGTVSTNVNSINAVTTALSPVLPASLIATQTDVASIITGVRALQMITMHSFKIPDTGFAAYKVELAFRDKFGALATPSGAIEIQAQVANTGTTWNGKLYTTAACTVNATVVGGWCTAVIDGGVGLYELYLKIDSTESPVDLQINARATDTGNVFQVLNLIPVEDGTGDTTATLIDNDSNKMVIAKAIRAYDVDLAAIALNVNSIEGKSEAITTAIQSHIETHLDGSISDMGVAINAHTDFATAKTTTDVNSHMDTYGANMVTGINAHTDSIETAINAHTDSVVGSAVTTIDSHTDSATGGVILDVNAHTDLVSSGAVTSINSHTDGVAGLIEGHVDASILASDTVVNGHIDSEMASAVSHIDASILASETAINLHTDSVAVSGSIAANMTMIDGVPLASATLQLKALHISGDTSTGPSLSISNSGTAPAIHIESNVSAVDIVGADDHRFSIDGGTTFQSGMNVRSIYGEVNEQFNKSVKTMATGVIDTASSNAEFTATVSVVGMDKTYIGRSLIFTSGTLINSACLIKAYTASTPQSFAVSALPATPSTLDTFIIV